MLLDNDATFEQNADGLYVKRTQLITSEFLDELKSERAAKREMKHAELNRFASVPTSVIEIWLRQGKDPWNASKKEIVSWLQRDGLDVFITANV